MHRRPFQIGAKTRRASLLSNLVVRQYERRFSSLKHPYIAKNNTNPKCVANFPAFVEHQMPAGANLAWQPMTNREIQAAWKYHDGTKHSSWSVRNHPHFLDWENRPFPFKVYPKIDPLPLPRDVPQTGVAAL